jgi:hypothetical protein
MWSGKQKFEGKEWKLATWKIMNNIKSLGKDLNISVKGQPPHEGWKIVGPTPSGKKFGASLQEHWGSSILKLSLGKIRQHINDWI